LDVTGLGSLDSSIDQSLAPAHSVEEELDWCQSGEVGILNEATRLRAIVVLDEVRQGPVTESEWNALALHVLLTDTGDDLENGIIETKEYSEKDCLLERC
jgi:hypothetical protein